MALSIALGAALLAVAFLLGRESAGTPNREAVEAAVSPTPSVEPQSGRSAEEESATRWPKWADPTDWDDSNERTTVATEAVGERIERPQKNDTFAFANSGSRPEPQPASNPPNHARPEDRGASVAAYFQDVDVIHTEEGAGDPNAFAMNLIKGGLGGATSGFDQLITDTKQMELEMQRLTPPPSCESYHKASVEALVESRQMLEDMKQAITGRDIQRLNAIALQSKSLQSKAQAIKEMREQILASSNAY